MPPKEDSKVIVDENTKAALQKAMLKRLSRLKVFAVGELVTKFVQKGDEVLVDPSALTDERTPIITVEDDNGKEVIVVLIQDHNIIHVWES